jgi:sugar lactone lactonase YvrE
MKKDAKPERLASIGSNSGAAALGPDGSLYLGEKDKLYRIDPEGKTTTVATDLGDIYGITVDSKGTAFVTDWQKTGRVLRIEAGKATPLVSHLEFPSGIVQTTDGSLLVKESGRQTNSTPRIRRLTPSGQLSLLATLDRD